jgi:2-dehydro-3-deoxyphosphogluconate aldolase/(4S)-4-hydroxy-2-oxoglutarate aldolase
MEKSDKIINTLKEQGLLPLYFHADKNVSIEILRALYRSGVRVIEFTNRGEEALENFSLLRKTRDEEMPDLYLAAGTVKTRQHALAFIVEGADFIISPGFNEEVGKVANEKNRLWLPGCMTPSEIMQAEELGASVIKLFPGNLLGPGFLTSIKELFPALSFIPTGGVKIEEENLGAWFKSGVIAVGAGSTLIDKEEIKKGNYNSVEQAARKALEMIKKVRKA